jgi:O-antigen ligase
MLGVGHPHDAFLQIWSELGIVGAGLAAAAVIAMMRGLASVPPARLAPRLAAIAAAAAIGLVGHGAWQGWWIAVIGATILLLRFAAGSFPATIGEKS